MQRIPWGPPEDGACVTCLVPLEPMPLPQFLAGIKKIQAALDAPVQAVRPDRVVSPLHVHMAAWHATRAHQDSRGRSGDRAVEFLLYLAGDRQINRAIASFGVRSESDDQCLLVVLRPLELARVREAVHNAFGATPLPWPGAYDRPNDATAAARTWWLERSALGPQATLRDAEDAVLAAMADLAVARL